MKLFTGGAGTIQSRMPRADHNNFFRKWGNRLLLVGGMAAVVSFGLEGKADAYQKCGPRMELTAVKEDGSPFRLKLLVDRQGLDEIKKIAGENWQEEFESTNPINGGLVRHLFDSHTMDLPRDYYDFKKMRDAYRARGLDCTQQLCWYADNAELGRVLHRAGNRVRLKYKSIEKSDKNEPADTGYLEYALSKNLPIGVCATVLDSITTIQQSTGHQFEKETIDEIITTSNRAIYYVKKITVTDFVISAIFNTIYYGMIALGCAMFVILTPFIAALAGLVAYNAFLSLGAGVGASSALFFKKKNPSGRMAPWEKGSLENSPPPGVLNTRINNFPNQFGPK